MSVGGSAVRRTAMKVSGLLIALSLIAPSLARATCGYLDWVKPAAGSSIPRNPLIVLGRFNDPEIASYEPYLASASDSVALVERERFGTFGPTVVTFEPEQALQANTRYLLRFRRPSDDLRFPDAEWTTSDVWDDAEPAWSGEPALDLDQSRAEGDGFFGYRVVFKVPFAESEGATSVILEVESADGEPLENGVAKRRLRFGVGCPQDRHPIRAQRVQ